MTSRIKKLLAAFAAAAFVVPTAFAQQPTNLQLYNINAGAVGGRWLLQPGTATSGLYAIRFPNISGTMVASPTPLTANRLMATDGSGNATTFGLGAGGIVYGTANQPTLLAAGTGNYVLRMNPGGTAPVWTAGSSFAWVLGGNAAPASNNLGTTDATSLNIVTGGTPRITIAGAGGISALSTLTINDGASADLVLNETSITRAGNIAINPGAANTLSTNGSASVGAGLTVTGATTLNGASTIGNGDDNVYINAGAASTFQLASNGLVVSTAGDISDAGGAVIVNDAQGLNVQAGGIDVDAGGLNVDAGGVKVVLGGLDVDAGTTTIDGTVSLNNVGAANTTTIGNNTVGNTLSINSPTVNLGNVPTGSSASNFVVRNGTALEIRSLSNLTTGTGTANQMTRWTGTSTLGDASLSDNGSGTLARAGNVAINTGAANTLSTDGSASVGVALTVTGATNLNGASTIGSGDDNVYINAGAANTFQLASSGLVVSTAGDISDAGSAVIVNDAQGLNVQAGGIDVDAGGLNVDAGGVKVVLGGLDVDAGTTTIDGTVSLNNVAAGNTTTIGNNTVGNTISLNAPVINAANLPAGTASDALITTDGTALRETSVATMLGNTAWLVGGNTITGSATTLNLGVAAQAGSEDALAIQTDGTARLTFGGTGGITAATTLDMNTNAISNIGAAGTDFSGTGGLTLADALTVSPTTNQIILGTTNTTTLNAVAPAASRTYTIPDAGANASFVMSEGTATINGAKTHLGNIAINNSSAGTTDIGTGTNTGAVTIGNTGNSTTFGSEVALGSVNQAGIGGAGAIAAFTKSYERVTVTEAAAAYNITMPAGLVDGQVVYLRIFFDENVVGGNGVTLQGVGGAPNFFTWAGIADETYLVHAIYDNAAGEWQIINITQQP